MNKKTDNREKSIFGEEQLHLLGKEKQALLKAMDMAVNLSNYSTSLNKIESPRLILETTAARVQTVIRFKAIAFYLVNEQDSSFDQAYCDPEESATFIEEEVNILIDDKTFSLALRINKPTIVTSSDKSAQIMLHPLLTISRIKGMFIGILAQDKNDISDISHILFTISMVTTADALESFGLYQSNRKINKELEASIKKLEASEKELIRHRENLELLLTERTSTNQKLQQDIRRRKRAEKALKQAEEKYRSIFENAAEGIFQAAPDGHYLSANPALARICGYDAPEELMQEVATISRQLNIDQTRLDEFMRILEHRGAINNLETQIYRKDGSTSWVSINAHAVRDEQGSLLCYEGTMMDITEKKVLEAQLLQSQKIEAVGCLAGGVAHDFNNILMAIIGYTEMALYKVPEETPLRHDLDQILKAGSRASDLVKQILAFSRQTEQERKPLQIISLIKEALKLMRSSIPSTIEIRQELAITQGKDIILADPTQIHQVLMNLCTNAAHAMRTEGGILTVHLSDVEADSSFVLRYPGLKPGSFLRLTVKDTGHGMDAAVMERIFDPYFTTKSPGEGTGLGLAVVHAIVKSHNGAIAVNSERGKGTTFQVFLPRIDEQIAHPVEISEALPTGNERILFIDDEKALANLAQEMIKSLGYSITTETDSLQALKTFRSQPDAFDLVITDMTMPGMTGNVLAKEIMAIRPDIPIILCTGFSQLISEKQAKEIGVREFIMKPFTTTKLAQVLRKVLDEQ